MEPYTLLLDGALIATNARFEWRGAEDVEMQTGCAIPRPLQADSWASSFFSGPFYKEVDTATNRCEKYDELKQHDRKLPRLDIS
jgi:hypothetical protein